MAHTKLKYRSPVFPHFLLSPSTSSRQIFKPDQTGCIQPICIVHCAATHWTSNNLPKSPDYRNLPMSCSWQLPSPWKVEITSHHVID